MRCVCWLSRLHDGQFTNFTTTNHLAGDLVHAICETPDGVIWFGTDRGLSRWENGAFSDLSPAERLSGDSISALYLDKEESLWIGTSAGGLSRLKRGKVTTYTAAQGLFSDEIFAILEDDYG